LGEGKNVIFMKGDIKGYKEPSRREMITPISPLSVSISKK